MTEMRQDRIALDRSARTVNEDGHMRVLGSVVSKAVVSDYYGQEIPNADGLGLQPNKAYRLYRDAASLAASADSLNGKPLLATHRPQTAGDHAHEIVVGSLDNARWEAPNLIADLTVWVQEGIDVVESGEQRALSCGYRYVADMTPGIAPDGTPYDGRMTEIAMNHCALVSEGRVPGAFVSDSKPAAPRKGQHMQLKTKGLSRSALAAGTALRAYLAPKMAADQSIDLTPLVAKIKAKSWKRDQPKLKAALDKALDGKLGKDMDIDDLGDVLEIVAQVVDDDDEPVAADADKPDDQKEGESDEDYKKRKAAKAQDADKDDDKPVKKSAMDAAIAAASKQAADAAEAATIKRFQAIHQAERDVQPYIGAIAERPDSAAAVYKIALDALRVDITDVPPEVYGNLLRALPKPSAAAPAPRVVAMDASATADRAKRFPHANRLAS